MSASGQHEASRHIGHQAFRTGRTPASFSERALIVISYATASAIIALAVAHWPASVHNTLTTINVLPELSSASGLSNRVHKVDRSSGMPFEERWRAMPAPSAVLRADKNPREAPLTERREKIPFSCELAFSRLVTRGNFSTRCIAGLETSTAGI